MKGEAGRGGGGGGGGQSDEGLCWALGSETGRNDEGTEGPSGVVDGFAVSL